MGDSRMSVVLERIERALARIEAAADTPAPAPQAEKPAGEGLRAKVEEAIARLDSLLGEERG